MASCARCGGELPATARFCPACGRPVEPEVGPPAPLPVRPILAGFRLPAWVTSDWPLVGLGVVLMLALLFGTSALVGLVAAAAVAGDIGAAPCGAAVGAHLAFAAFGARIFAGCGVEHGSALAIGFLPLPWALIGGVAVEAARRFAWRRLPDDRTRRVAYAGKLALAFGVALGIIAGLVARGDPVRRGSGFASSLNGGEVWFYSSVLIWFWAWVGLRRHGLGILPAVQRSARPERLGRVRRLGRGAAEGVVTFGLLAGGLAVVGLLFALVVADGPRSRIGLVFGFPVVGFSFGAGLVDGAMGAALGGLGGHTSLTRFGLPAGRGAGAGPAWLFIALMLAPAAVAVTTWRRLERERPAEEQGALAIGALIGVGFAAAAWLAALLGRIVLLASATRATGGWFTGPPEGLRFTDGGTVGTIVALRPNPAAVLGLGLLWGLAGGLGTAFLWASRHNASWQISGGPAGPAGDAPPAPPPPTSTPEPAWLLPETPPTPVPPPEPPSGTAASPPTSAGSQEGGVGGGEVSSGPGVEPPGGKP
ncbi:MAG TPA: zinc ribbon domain-containing protein [Acidimicrobiia bacterium]|nr:zinc ribbon domain-containing protein [Acidimicrobiia bacterium]